MTHRESLPDSAFVVLALIAERETHGYEIQKLVHNRGFRFWTNLQRSSIYNALTLLEREGLVSVRSLAGEGPERKVFRNTKKGADALRREGVRHLSQPSHPRNEIDLGIYALPFIGKADAGSAVDECLAGLRGRAEFLKERLTWCRARSLRLPALAFERPLVALEAEIAWLEEVVAELKRGGDVESDEWSRYEYREPPGPDAKEESPSKRKRVRKGSRNAARK